MEPSIESLSFFQRLGLAWACLTNSALASQAAKARAALDGTRAAEPEPAIPAERVHASGLAVLAMLQREGRLIDFLRDDVAAYPDADVGAAARVVHAGCRKVLDQCLDLAPVLPQAEGDRVAVPAGFDAQRIRLTGHVAGQPPFKGTLRHHGWAATAVRLPAVNEAMDPRVLAPAEVEL